MNVRPTKGLSLLVSTLEENLKALGFVLEDRTFLPHITLGRITKSRRKPIMLQPTITANSQHVSYITLFESQLSPEGSKYSVLQLFPLRAVEKVSC
jgi:2'-5' RNA ligase